MQNSFIHLHAMQLPPRAATSKASHISFCSIARFCPMASPSTPRQRPLTDINDQIRDVITDPASHLFSCLDYDKTCVVKLLRMLLLMHMTAHSQVLASLPTVTCSSEILNVTISPQTSHSMFNSSRNFQAVKRKFKPRLSDYAMKRM